jgi:hypothetical protein
VKTLPAHAGPWDSAGAGNQLSLSEAASRRRCGLGLLWARRGPGSNQALLSAALACGGREGAVPLRGAGPQPKRGPVTLLDGGRGGA